MLANQSKFRNLDRRQKQETTSERYEQEHVNVSHMFYFVRASSFRRPLVTSCLYCRGFNILQVFFYMGEDHSLPFCVYTDVLLCILRVTLEQFFFFLCCTESRVGRSKLSSAIDLELFEQGRTFDPRAQAIFTYSQLSEYICSIMA